MKQIGTHISYGTLSKGLAGVFDIADSIDADVIQVYTDNPRSFMPKMLTAEAAQSWHTAAKKSGKLVVSHASVMINLANSDPKKAAFAKKAFYQELKKADQLGISMLVLHVGAHMGSGVVEGLKTFVANMDDIIEKAHSNCQILLETMPKAGTRMGNDFMHIAYIIEHSRFKEKLGVCLDTCHIWAAGYDLRNDEAYEETIRSFDEIIGLEYLKLVHIQDAKKDLGKPEAHEEIGMGKIPIRFFYLIMNDPRFEKIPFILELSKVELAKVGNNILRLRTLQDNFDSN